MADGPIHECRQGRRCKARVRDAEDEWHGAGVERPNTLCRPCEEDAFAAIRQLADDYLELGKARTAERSRISGPKISGSSERSIPIQLAADSLMSDIDVETTRWAVRLTRGNPIPNDNCFTVICSNLGTLVDLPPQSVTVWIPHPDGGDNIARTVYDGVDAVLGLSALHHRAQKVLGMVDTISWLAESCHMCGLRALMMNIGQGTIHCRGCRNVWDQNEFARLNNPLAVA